MSEIQREKWHFKIRYGEKEADREIEKGRKEKGELRKKEQKVKIKENVVCYTNITLIGRNYPAKEQISETLDTNFLEPSKNREVTIAKQL